MLKVLAFLAIVSPSAFANLGAECQSLKAACEKGGYKMGGEKGKSLIVDCIEKFGQGHKVAGVDWEPGSAANQACMNFLGIKKLPVEKPKKK